MSELKPIYQKLQSLDITLAERAVQPLSVSEGLHNRPELLQIIPT